MRRFYLLLLAAAAARKVQKPPADDLCKMCWQVAVQARRALGFHVRRDAAPNATTWKRALLAGCPAGAGRRRCEEDLVGRHAEDLAYELEDLFDEAEGDETFLNLGEVSAALCGHESPTKACPPDVHGLRPVEDDVAKNDAGGKGVKVALRNVRGEGAVEVHVVDLNEDTECAESEAELLATGASPAARFVEPGEESSFFLSFLGPDGEPVERPTLRVKPRGAPCGVAERVDVAVDFSSPFTIFAVDAPGESSRIFVTRVYHENPEL